MNIIKLVYQVISRDVCGFGAKPDCRVDSFGEVTGVQLYWLCKALANSLEAV